MQLKTKDQHHYLQASRFEETNLVTHGFSTRSTTDIPSFLKLLDLDGPHATGEQVHGDQIHIATEPSPRKIKDTDAIITNQPGLPLIVRGADCLPILILDPVKKVIATVHAGWKGTVARIVEKTVKKMQSEFNCNPADLLAAIGPAIGACCFEVDQPVLEKFRSQDPNWQEIAVPKSEKKWQIDLKEANIYQLKACGVKEENITVSSFCTSCHNDLFFSYRKERDEAGRMFGVIMLR